MAVTSVRNERSFVANLLRDNTAVMVVCSALALIFANAGNLFDSQIAHNLTHAYHAFFHEDKYTFLGHTDTLGHWVTTIFLTPFFLYLGLELFREFRFGKLNNRKTAMAPFFGALGGVTVPMGIFAFIVTYFKVESAINGFPIPSATDVAFTIMMLNFFKNMDGDLRAFIVALAVLDDLFAVLMTAILFSSDFNGMMLGGVGAVVVCLWVLRRMGVQSLTPYLALGAVMWVFMLNSGIHATLSAVLLAYFIPFSDRQREALVHEQEEAREKHMKEPDDHTHDPAHWLENKLDDFWVPMGLGLFCLVGAGVTITTDAIMHPVAIASAVGLLLGKPLGIVAFVAIAMRVGLVNKPTKSWLVFIGGGFAAGIGFTMSFFMAGLAYAGSMEFLSAAQTGVIMGSVASAIVAWLCWKAAGLK